MYRFIIHGHLHLHLPQIKKIPENLYVQHMYLWRWLICLELPRVPFDTVADWLSYAMVVHLFITGVLWQRAGSPWCKSQTSRDISSLIKYIRAEWIEISIWLFKYFLNCNIWVAIGVLKWVDFLCFLHCYCCFCCCFFVVFCFVLFLWEKSVWLPCLFTGLWVVWSKRSLLWQRQTWSILRPIWPIRPEIWPVRQAPSPRTVRSQTPSTPRALWKEAVPWPLQVIYQNAPVFSLSFLWVVNVCL